jgi:hypothetical protein
VTIHVFCGPTISAEEARAEIDAVFLPPAAQGDVYRAALDRPRAIGIVDGYFERIPSVWHKEILWAMAQGIHVFGSASIGALRAAELAAFGMEGIGAVYEAFRSGELEDDDEVAVAHGSADEGYRAASEAMVNVRATLRAAAAAGVVGDETRAELTRIAKDLFYADRAYPLILARGAERGLPGRELEALASWLPEGCVNLKRADALAMLRVMRERFAGAHEPKRVRYAFEHTDAWDQVRRRTGRLRPIAGGAGPIPAEALAEELRVQGKLVPARQGALVRALALDEAQRQGVTVNADVLQATTAAFRRERELFDVADTERWMADHGLTLDDFTRLMRDEARLRWAEIMFEPEAMRRLADHLRASGEYTGLLARIEAKRLFLAQYGDEGAGDQEPAAEAMWRWYFEVRLGRPMPPDVEAYARSAGFADADELRRAAAQERRYLRHLEAGPPSRA